MKKDWKLVKRETLHQGWFSIYRYHFTHTLFAGGWSTPIDREVFERGNVVAVLPYDAAEDSVVLVEQFRIGAMHDDADPWMIEVIAGMVEKGEQPEEVAVRESQEEAGLVVSELIPIREYYASPGGSTERVNIFCAPTDLSAAGGLYGLDAEDEDIRVIKCSADEAISLLDSGEIKNAISIIALMWFKANHQRLRAKDMS